MLFISDLLRITGHNLSNTANRFHLAANRLKWNRFVLNLSSVDDIRIVRTNDTVTKATATSVHCCLTEAVLLILAALFIRVRFFFPGCILFIKGLLIL